MILCTEECQNKNNQMARTCKRFFLKAFDLITKTDFFNFGIIFKVHPLVGQNIHFRMKFFIILFLF